MSYRRPAQPKLVLCRALLLAALPMACAVGVDPSFEDGGPTAGDAGSSSGGSSASAGSGGAQATAGKTNAGGTASNPFGGTASNGGSSGGTGSAGSGTAGGAAGTGGAGGGGKGGSGGSSSGSGGTGGSGGGSAGGGDSGGGSGGGSGCACPKTLTWVDNTVLNWSTGDCLDVSGTKYLYTGTKAQTYANSQCNPTKQEAWCTDGGNDYKFMACK